MTHEKETAAREGLISDWATFQSTWEKDKKIPLPAGFNFSLPTRTQLKGNTDDPAVMASCNSRIALGPSLYTALPPAAPHESDEEGDDWTEGEEKEARKDWPFTGEGLQTALETGKRVPLPKGFDFTPAKPNHMAREKHAAQGGDT